MARKGVGELTRDETAILVVAAKFLCALERLEADLPTSEELAAFTQSATEELKAVRVIFNKKDVGMKMPRVHPVLQAISKEWKAARGDNRVPSWDGITLEYVAQLCKKTEEIYPNWHASLMSVNLREYLVGIEPSKMWWLSEEEEDDNDADVVMLNAPPPPSKSQSSLAPPKSTITTRAKGKAPAIPKPALPPAPQPRPRAKKRCADDSPDAAIIKSDDTAPRKSGRPQVEVVITSPPRQGKRRQDNSPAVATGAIARRKSAYPSLRGSVSPPACTCCAKNCKMCNPPAVWASADARSVSSARTRTPRAAADAQIEALTQQVQDMSLELSKVKKTLDISLEEIRRGHEESREEAWRGREEFHTARLYMHNTSLMVTVLLAKQGIVSASIPGIGQPPPSLSRSRSPANPPTTSPGIPLSTLKISNARSAASSRTSSATSERQCAMTELPSASVAGSLASRQASPSGPLPGASATASRPASPSGPLPGASATASRQASPSGPLPAPPEGTGSSRKSSPGQQEPQLFRVPRTSQLLSRLGEDWGALVQSGPHSSNGGVVNNRTLLVRSEVSAQRPTALEALGARINPLLTERVDVVAIAPWEVPNWEAHVTYEGLADPNERKAYVNGLYALRHEQSTLIIRVAGTVSNRNRPDNLMVGGAAASLWQGEAEPRVRAWTLGTEVETTDVHLFGISKAAELISAEYSHAPPSHIYILSSDNGALSSIRNSWSLTHQLEVLRFHAALSSFYSVHRDTSIHLVWSKEHRKRASDTQARLAALAACTYTPSATIKRMRSPAFVKRAQRAFAFRAWARDWIIRVNSDHPPPARAYGHSIHYHTPPDGRNHPLWSAAIPPKTPSSSWKPITRRTHCTAMQLATLHSFTSNYTATHRPDLPPEAAQCQCGFPDKSFYHLVYDCPLFEAQRDYHLFSDQRPESTEPLELFTGEGNVAHDFCLFLQTSGAASQPENVPIMPFDPG
ncbi:hypothetical protein EDB85DRAFT_2175145 [Lactarius pseudohatsudake]|nr:hypothetical protein EDB85DRAFT_2175145 [Lactarius pseudohatsudake]